MINPSSNITQSNKAHICLNLLTIHRSGGPPITDTPPLPPYLHRELLEVCEVPIEHVPHVVVVATGGVVVVPVDGSGDHRERHRGGGARPDVSRHRLPTVEHRPQEQLVPRLLQVGWGARGSLRWADSAGQGGRGGGRGLAGPTALDRPLLLSSPWFVTAAG